MEIVSSGSKHPCLIALSWSLSSQLGRMLKEMRIQQNFYEEGKHLTASTPVKELQVTSDCLERENYALLGQSSLIGCPTAD